MLTMRQAAKEVGMSYDTLKFYCKEELVPNIHRDKNNYRIFSDENMVWLKSLQCFKEAGMSIKELKNFLSLSKAGNETLALRREILINQKDLLIEKRKDIDHNLDYIEHKIAFYDDILNKNSK